MRICIFAEGSYPYITGGVSSWIQTLVTAMSQHEFIIYAIGAEEKNKGKFKYILPPNIVEIKEVFLDSYLNDKGSKGKKIIITSKERETIEKLISGEPFEWKYLFDFIFKNEKSTVSEFLLSKECYDIICKVAEEKYPYIAFNDLFWTIRSMFLTLLEVIKNGVPEADIYHSVSTGYAGVMASVGKYLYNKPLILTEHGIYTREREEEIIKADWVQGYFKDTWIKYFYNLSKCAYDYSDVAISLFERNRFIQMELGCDEAKTFVIPNGIKNNTFEGIALNKKEDGYINVGAILRIVPIKDVKTIIQGFAVASEQLSNIRLYIMGPTEENEMYYEECVGLVEALNMKNIIFTGQINVKDYIVNMDILLLGSISEGMPLAVLEGMAAKKPHVLTDVGSCRELMFGRNDSFGEAGIVIPVMDYQALGNSIVKLCKNKKLREEMGNNAFERVSNIYTLDSFINSYKDIYEKEVKKQLWQE